MWLLQSLCFIDLLVYLFQAQCCFNSTVTVRTTDRSEEPRTSTLTFTQLLRSQPPVQVRCYFTSTETMRTIIDGGSQNVYFNFHTALELTATSSSSKLLYVHRDHEDNYRRGIPECPLQLSHSSWGHSHQFKFKATLRPQRPWGQLQTGDPRMSTSTFTQLLRSQPPVQVQTYFTSTETMRTIRDGVSQDVHLDFHTAPELWQLIYHLFSLHPHFLLVRQLG